MMDRELLREYLESQSEQAFAQLVARHVNLVYSAALRVLRDPHLAQDASQSTFVLLARKAHTIREPDALAGWLYRAAVNSATNLLHAERRRREREAEAVSRAEPNAETAWEEIRPLLEEAMRQLKPAEQDALVLRYFAGQSMREASRRLAISEDALQKRAGRALEKLRSHFARRGVTVSTMAIAAAVTTHAAQAAPAELASTLTSASLAGATATGATSSLLGFFAMTKVQALTLGLLFLAGLTTPKLVGLQPGGRGFTGQASLPATGPRTTGSIDKESVGVAATPAPTSAAFLALGNWLQQADRSPFLVSHGDDELRRLVRALGTDELPQAWALGANLRYRALRRKFVPALVDRWAGTDAPAALKAILALPGPRERQNLLDEAVAAWSRTQPAAAAAWVNSFYPEPDRAARLRPVLGACGEMNPKAAWALWQQMPAGIPRDEALRTFIGSLAQQDLSAALACLDKVQSSHIRKAALSDLLEQWAKKDATAALAWAQAQPTQHGRDETVGTIIAGTMEANPAQAAELLQSLSATTLEKDRGLIASVVQSWAKNDFSATTTWATQLPEGPLRERALESLLPEWVAQDPQAAVNFALSLPEGTAQAKCVGQVAFEWATRNSKATQGWLEGLPEGPVRNAALAGFGDGLAALKPEQAARFVAGLPPGDLQAEVALKVVTRWAMNDPQSAAAWVAAFPPGPTRMRAASAVTQQWSKIDRGAAEAWSRQTALLSAPN
jgi:RNA polymerase sigma factor (sigma-70 family)